MVMFDTIETKRTRNIRAISSHTWIFLILEIGQKIEENRAIDEELVNKTWMQ